jgi:serine/threonine protein kinase
MLPDSEEVTFETVFVLNPDSEEVFRNRVAESMPLIWDHIELVKQKEQNEEEVKSSDSILKLAFDGKKFAMKMIEGEDFDDPIMLKKLAAGVWSANVVMYHIILDMPGYRLVLMEDCVAGDLEHAHSEETYSEDGLRCMVRGALHGLSALHSLGLVHCDVKTSNIMCTEADFKGYSVSSLDVDAQKRLSSSIKLVDLSEATEFGDKRGHCGTDLAPEIWKELCDCIRNDLTENERKTWTREDWDETEKFEDLCPAGPAEDLWSLGIVFYELAMKDVLYDDDKLQRIAWTGDYEAVCQYMKGQIASVRSAFIERGFSDAAIDFLLRLLEVEPGSRATWQSALQHEWLTVVSL